MKRSEGEKSEMEEDLVKETETEMCEVGQIEGEDSDHFEHCA